ncbi:phage tail tip fiber protein [Pseudoalteromonas sp. GB43]
MAKTALPPVPKDVPRSVSHFLTALRETVQVQSGMGRGNHLDRAVTFRDLKVGTGTTDLRRLAVNSSAEGDKGGFGDPIPPQPTGLDVYAMFTAVGLKWDRPAGDWYALTEVFRVDITETPDATPTFAEALFVGSSTSGFYSDSVNGSSTYVYWIRHLNRDYQAGAPSNANGVRVTTKDNPEQVLEDYSEQVFNGENYDWLQSELGAIDALNRALQGNGFGDTSLSKLLSENSSVSDLLADQAMSDAISKHTQGETIQKQFAKNYARLAGGIHAAVNADEAYVMRIQNLEARWENDLGDVINSKIEEFETVLTNQEGALAQAIRDFRVDYNGESASLQQLASASASASSGYQAQWGVKTNVQDLQGGVGFFNDGTETSFVVDAQTFAVTGGNDTVAPFIIKDGKTVIDAAVINTAEIFSLVAQNVTAEKIRAGTSFKSPAIEGGSIKGSTLEIGTNFLVNNQGVLTAKNAFFSGQVNANAGRLQNVVIDESCEVKGTLKATNVEGDIVDRAVVVVNEEYTVGALETYTLISGTIEAGILGETNDRNLVVSGIALDHQGGGGSSSNFIVTLYLDGEVKQVFRSKNVGEEGSVTVQLGCVIPKGKASHSFSVQLRPDVNDNILVQQSAIVADIFKSGSTLTNVRGLY